MARFHALSSGNTGQPASEGLGSGTPASPAATTPASTDESTPVPAATPASADGSPPAPESERAMGPPHAERASNTQLMRIYEFKRPPMRISTCSQCLHRDSACPPGRDPTRSKGHGDEQQPGAGDEIR